MMPQYYPNLSPTYDNKTKVISIVAVVIILFTIFAIFITAAIPNNRTIEWNPSIMNTLVVGGFFVFLVLLVSYTHIRLTPKKLKTKIVLSLTCIFGIAYFSFLSFLNINYFCASSIVESRSYPIISMDSTVTTRQSLIFFSSKSVAKYIYVYDTTSNDTVCIHLHDELYRKAYSHESTIVVPLRKGYFGYWVY